MLGRLTGATLGLLAATSAGAVELRGEARLWTGQGYDSNVRRDFVSPGTPTSPDVFAFGMVTLEGLLASERVRLWGSYDAAGRAFLFQPGESMEVQNGQAEASLLLGRLFSLGLSGSARDRRGAARDYTDLLGQALVAFSPDASLDFRLLGGAHRFLYWQRFGYSHWGPELSLQARYRFDRHHGVSLFGSLNLRTHNENAANDPNDPSPPPARVRADSAVTAGVTYTYRGPFQLSVGYSFYDQTSNSFGESLQRHRVTLAVGLRLPWKLSLLGTLTAQFARYPDGVYLAPDLLVLEDQESSSSVTLKLVRPLWTHLDLDLRFALYFNVLPQNDFTYLRAVGTVGLTVSL